MNMDRSMAISAGVALIVPLAYYGWSRITNKNLPPLAKASFSETFKALSEFELVDLWLKAARDVGNIFQLRTTPIPPYAVVVGDPDLIHKILLDKQTRKPRKFFKSFEAVLGPNIFNQTDHSIWRPIRKGVAPAFSPLHIGRMNRVCSEYTQQWMKERLEPMIDEGVAFDPAKEFLVFTVKVICKTAFEFDTTTEETEKFLDELELYLKEFAAKSLFNPFRSYFHSILPEARRAYQAAEWIGDFCGRILEAYRSNPSPTPGTVIDLIAKSSHYSGDKGRISDLSVFLIAGHDTTGYSLAWILLALAKNEGEQTKLRQALQELPESEWTNSPALQNAIREGMRLNPVAPIGSLRRTAREFVSKDGIVIPSGTDVFLTQILPNRDPNLIKNPDKFIPSRWENDDMNERLVLPFSAGPRNCVGRGLAMAELNSLVSQLIGKYRFTLVEEGHPELFLTYKPVGSKIMAHRI